MISEHNPQPGSWIAITSTTSGYFFRLILMSLISTARISSASADELFIGTFESETRENFGSGTAGEYRIDVAATSERTYEATLYRRGKLLGKVALVPCPVAQEQYLINRPPGRAEVLCNKWALGSLGPFLSYSENGISALQLKDKYLRNPELVKAEGLEPGDPALFERKHYSANYYARVQAYCYGFRKIR
jgi:hypothetical protein